MFYYSNRNERRGDPAATGNIGASILTFVVTHPDWRIAHYVDDIFDHGAPPTQDPARKEYFVEASSNESLWQSWSNNG